jgi:hypothetical protein
MAITEVYTLNNVSVGGTELSIVSGTTSLQTITDDGHYSLLIDDNGNMTETDAFKIRLYEKVLAGSTKKVFAWWSIAGAQSEAFITPSFPLIHGWDMTIQKISGSDRAFYASIRKS